jgi:hypothetical protein
LARQRIAFARRHVSLRASDTVGSERMAQILTAAIESNRTAPPNPDRILIRRKLQTDRTMIASSCSGHSARSWS